MLPLVRPSVTLINILYLDSWSFAFALFSLRDGIRLGFGSPRVTPSPRIVNAVISSPLKSFFDIEEILNPRNMFLSCMMRQSSSVLSRET
ncbi:hypothetical protein K474DRAFT_973009 [Panus rudis PR-1116 ss-1]|nr:hypothetical protein K474DRAFT_973009 [Panus rudis PR-1116 ss-1]